jgi:hypothetical protein
LTGQLSAISPQHMHALCFLLSHNSNVKSFAQPQGSNGLLLSYPELQWLIHFFADNTFF